MGLGYIEWKMEMCIEKKDYEVKLLCMYLFCEIFMFC